MSLCKLGYLEQGDPFELGIQVGDLVTRYPHMDICGGCCGTWDIHLDEIGKNILATQTDDQSKGEQNV